MSLSRLWIVVLFSVLIWGGCESPSPSSSRDTTASPPAAGTPYATVPLNADLSALPAPRKKMVPLLIEAAQAMDGIFWEQAYGNRDSLLQSLGAQKRRRAVYNYGPWDRLRSNESFVAGEGPRPPGANFYPTNVTLDSLNGTDRLRDTLRTPNTIVRRLPDGTLTALPYHLFFAESTSTAAMRLEEAADLAQNASLARYLRQRAEALTTGQYAPSTRTWHTLRNPVLDILIGPMDTGEDRLLGVKTSATAVVLQHAPTRSRRLARLSDLEDRPSTRSLLASLDLSVPDRSPHWAAYDALYVAGGANAGPKPAVLPLSPSNGPSRHLLLSNVLDARADSLLTPTAEQILSPTLQSEVTVDALFEHIALQSWSRPLLDAPEREASPSAVMTAALPIALSLALGPLPGENDTTVPAPTAHHATALTDLVHTIRLDTTSTHGQAALLAFNYLRGADAIRKPDDRTYTAVPDTMTRAGAELAHALLERRTDASAAAAFVDQYGTVAPPLRAALDRLDAAGVPRALAFEQGESVLQGLQPATAAR